MSTSEIELAGVSFGYPGRPMFEGLTLRLPPAAVTALTGPNGSGKSTLLGLVAGLHAPSSGEVTGVTEVAYVPQHSLVGDALPITVRDAVAMGRWARRGAWRPLTRRDRLVVAEYLELLDITDLARRRLGALSGGQRQRVLVAQGLAQGAPVLLLDEPSAGIDAPARERIAAAIGEQARRGVTVLHATHDPADADRADYRLALTGARPLAGRLRVIQRGD